MHQGEEKMKNLREAQVAGTMEDETNASLFELATLM
jgi:hypothetical protein